MKSLNTFAICAFVVIFMACGEAGIQINVSKVVSYDYPVDALRTNANDGNLNESNNIDLGSVEFERYNLAEIVIESIAYEISGLPEGFEDTFAMQLVVSGERLPPIQLVETPANSNFENSTEPVLMYSSLTPNQLVNLEAIAAIETLIRDGEDFEMLVQTDFPNLPNDLTMTYYFDVLGKIRE